MIAIHISTSLVRLWPVPNITHLRQSFEAPHGVLSRLPKRRELAAPFSPSHPPGELIPCQCYPGGLTPEKGGNAD